MKIYPILLGGILLTIPACSRSPGSAPAAGQGKSAAPAVTVVTAGPPAQKKVVRTIEQPGHIEAFEETPLHARIAGYIKEVKVDIGDPVEQGALLAELSVPELVEEWKQKQALVEQARAEVKQAESAHMAAKAKLRTAEALIGEAEAGRSRASALVSRWNSEYQRLEKGSKSTLDQQTVDETLYQLKAAEATREEVEARVKSAQAARDETQAFLDKAEADVSAANARRGVADAEERRLQALLAYSRITAPFAGVVTTRNVDTGHYLAAAGKGEPLFVVARMDRIRIFIDVPESEASLVGKDTPARIRIQALKGKEFPGTVTRTSWALDRKSHTLRTEVDLPNPDGSLRPGMYAYATLTIERPDVWTLPQGAVLMQGDRAFCYRVEDDKAVRTPLQVGISGGGLVEVLKKQTKPVDKGEAGTWEDLTGKEQIVLDNAGGLIDGQAVTAALPK